MATSKVPAAIDALVSILRASSALSGVRVIDGPPAGSTSDQADNDYVYVGWQPDSDIAAEMTQDFNAAGARTRDEAFTIPGTIDTWSGDTDMSARRARAFVLLAALEDAIRATGANPTAPNLNSTVLWAHLTNGNLEQASTEKGVRARIPFAVSCRARI